MAKKKKRKKRPSAGPGPQQEGQRTSARAERKEAARLERERRIRAIRRRRYLRRGIIGLVVLGAIGGITAFVLINNARESERREEAAALASTVGCQPANEDVPDEGAAHVPQPQPYQNVPASSGPHNASPLPPDVGFYDQPFDPTFEFRAVHNLEHGYVLMYYEQEGDNALPDDVAGDLRGLAESEEEVIMAPYPNLQEDENLVLVAWNTEQRCDVEGDAGDVRAVAGSFIDTYRNGPAPEAQIP